MNSLTSFWLPSYCALCTLPPLVLCDSCRLSFPLRPHQVSRVVNGFAACDYEGPALDLVHAFKRSGSTTLARHLALPMAELVANLRSAAISMPDKASFRLVPVPSRPDSMRRRGYVPATLLANAMAARLMAHHGVKSHASPLVRLTRKVKDQALLNLEEREANLTGAMVASPFQQMNGRLIDDSRRNVVLVDDVVTTGATLREMHRALQTAGWNPLFFVTFAETL